MARGSGSQFLRDLRHMPTLKTGDRKLECLARRWSRDDPPGAPSEHMRQEHGAGRD
ncbi:MAG: hypothetical protein ACYCVY_03815 [Acidiferrobacteraceae bacterium]